MRHIKKGTIGLSAKNGLKNSFNMCKTSFKNVNLVIICLSLTDWANLSNDLLFFGLLLGHNAKKCLIRATISGKTRSPFLQYPHFQHIVYHKIFVVISRKCCSSGICPLKQESQKEFSLFLS